MLLTVILTALFSAPGGGVLTLFFARLFKADKENTTEARRIREELRKDLDALGERYKEQQQEIEELRAEINKVRNENMALKDENWRLKLQKEELVRREVALEASNKAKDLEIADLRRDLADVRVDREFWRSHCEQAGIAVVRTPPK